MKTKPVPRHQMNKAEYFQMVQAQQKKSVVELEQKLVQQQNILSEFIKKSEEGSCAIQIKKEDISKIEGFQEFLNDLG